MREHDHTEHFGSWRSLGPGPNMRMPAACEKGFARPVRVLKVAKERKGPMIHSMQLLGHPVSEACGGLSHSRAAPYSFEDLPGVGHFTSTRHKWRLLCSLGLGEVHDWPCQPCCQRLLAVSQDSEILTHRRCSEHGSLQHSLESFRGCSCGFDRGLCMAWISNRTPGCLGGLSATLRGSPGAAHKKPLKKLVL